MCSLRQWSVTILTDGTSVGKQCTWVSRNYLFVRSKLTWVNTVSSFLPIVMIIIFGSLKFKGRVSSVVERRNPVFWRRTCCYGPNFIFFPFQWERRLCEIAAKTTPEPCAIVPYKRPSTQFYLLA